MWPDGEPGGCNTGGIGATVLSGNCFILEKSRVRKWMMGFRQGILQRFLFRSLVVWLAGVLVVGLVAWMSWQEATRQAEKIRGVNVQHYFRARIDQIGNDFGRDATRNAMYLGSRLAAEGGLPVGQALQAYYDALGGVLPFGMVRLLDAGGRVVAQYGSLPGHAGLPSPGSDWVFDAADNRLYRVYRRPVVAGTASARAVMALFYVAMDGMLLSGVAFPGTEATLLWHGRPVAGSPGAGAVASQQQGRRADDIVMRWDAQSAGSPQLVLHLGTRMLPLRELFLKGLVAASVFSLFAWLYLGRWVGGMAAQIRAQGKATEWFQHVRRVDARIESMLGKAAHSHDEIGKVAYSMLQLMHEIEHDQRERDRLVQQLALEKERAEVTLSSIGDGVIATDARGVVTFLNRTAETLTGWTLGEAKGRKLEEIFHIVSEVTRQRETNPLRRVIEERVVVGLANHNLLISRTGMEYIIEDTAAPILSPTGVLLGCVLVFYDNSERHRMEQHAHWLAGHDVLTGLPNRALLADRMNQAIAVVRRNERKLAVGFLDLDHFKQINDAYGHEIGDNILIEVARRIESSLRVEDTVARIGGDEFILLLNSINGETEVRQILDRLLENLSQPIVVERQTFEVPASIGVVVGGGARIPDADILLRQADQAMYQAKQSGRNCVHFFDSESDAAIQSRYQLFERIQQALQHREFRLHYQPKLNMRTGEVIGFEALIRWQHPDRGLLAPGQFLPQVEHTDLIIEIGEWVLDEVLLQIRRWEDNGVGQQKVSINISGRQLMQPDFAARMSRIMERHPEVPHSCIEFEILETASIEDFEHVGQLIHEFKQRGLRFSIDDFGTGYSSLSFLKHLPVDTLKIDHAFVRDMLDDPNDLALVEATISLARVFQREVIAEGVESIEHGYVLVKLGCDLAQGYGIARPMPGEVVPGWLRHNRESLAWSLWQFQNWEMVDFPLLVARHDHVEWVGHVLRIIQGGESRKSDALYYDPAHCRFGKWYHDLGHKRYGHLDVFRAIEPVHVEVNRVGMEVLQLHEAGRDDEARVLGEEMQRLRDRIVELLGALQALATRAEDPVQDTLFP